MQNIASYTSLTFSINFDKFIKQANRLPYMIGTTVNNYSFTPIVAGTLTYTDNLDIKRLIKTSPPYYPDKQDTNYTDINLDFNHIFIKFSQNGDASEKYVPYGGFYFKNTVTVNDDVLYDSFSGIGYYSRQPDVKYCLSNDTFLILSLNFLIISNNLLII